MRDCLWPFASGKVMGSTLPKEAWNTLLRYVKEGHRQINLSR